MTVDELAVLAVVGTLAGALIGARSTVAVSLISQRSQDRREQRGLRGQLILAERSERRQAYGAYLTHSQKCYTAAHRYFQGQAIEGELDELSDELLQLVNDAVLLSTDDVDSALRDHAGAMAGLLSCGRGESRSWMDNVAAVNKKGAIVRRLLRHELAADSLRTGGKP